MAKRKKKAKAMSEEKKTEAPKDETPKAEAKPALSPELQEIQEKVKALLARRDVVQSEHDRAASEKKRSEKELETIDGDLRQCSRDFAAGGTKQTALPFGETKKEKREALPPEDKSPRPGVKLTIAADSWAKLSEDDQRRIKHHATNCDAVLGEGEGGAVVISGVPSTLKGAALRSLLAELQVVYTLEDPTAPEVRVRILVRFAEGEAPDPAAWSRWIGALAVREVTQQKHDAGWLSSPMNRATVDYLELTTLLRDDLKWAYDIIEAKEISDKPETPPALEGPLNPDEEARKHLHAVYVQLTGNTHWERRYEGSQKEEAITAFTAATRECAHGRGEARRYQGGTQRRQYPTKKNGASEPEAPEAPAN